MKISQVQFLKEVQGKNLALLACPFKTWNSLTEEVEEQKSKWLNIAYKYNTANVAQKNYALASVKGKRLNRGDSSLNIAGYEVYKYANKYILIKVTEDKNFDEFSIKLILYSCL